MDPADDVFGDAAPVADQQPSGRARIGIWWIVPLSALLAWEACSRFGLVPSNWFPAPAVVARTWVDLARSGELLRHVFATTARLLLGFGIGATAGTLLGALCGKSRFCRELLDPTLQALRSIPSLAWVPLFLLWLGIQETSKVALIALGAFFPVYLNLMTGILAIDPKLVEVGALHGYTRLSLTARVLVPAALPAYVTGLRSGLGLAWMFVVAAELLGASRGLGYLMLDGQATGRPELVLSALGTFAILGKVSDHAIEALAERLRRSSFP